MLYYENSKMKINKYLKFVIIFIIISFNKYNFQNNNVIEKDYYFNLSHIKM